MVHKLALVFGAVGVAGVVALALVLGGSPFAGFAVADNGTAALADDPSPAFVDEATASPSPRVKTIVDTVFVRPAPTADPTARSTSDPTAEPTAAPAAEPTFDDRGHRGSGDDDDRSGRNSGHDGDDDDFDDSHHGRHGHDDDDSDEDHSGHGHSGHGRSGHDDSSDHESRDRDDD